jgi:hypothetical protein
VRSRRLDFVVFGVPRSGTKGLARALNLHPNVYCALERLPYDVDPARLTFPDAFLTKRDLRDRRRLPQRDRIARVLLAKPDVRHVGNKNPRYYLTLEMVNAGLPELRNLWIYRSPSGLMQSWDRKQAHYRSSANWQRGQVGLFGLLELLCCLDTCSRFTRDIFVFPYEAGLNGSSVPIIQALEFLGADPTTFDRAAFTSKHLPKRRSDAHRDPLHEHERELLDALHAPDLDLILDQRRGFLVSSVRQELREYLALVGDRLPAALDQAFTGYRDPAVRVYGAAFFARHRRELERLVAMAAGRSRVLADFQRYTVHRRLRSVYLQRRTFAKKLAATRLPL